MAERRMFGGLAFLVDGTWPAVSSAGGSWCASGDGADEALGSPRLRWTSRAGRSHPWSTSSGRASHTKPICDGGPTVACASCGRCRQVDAASESAAGVRSIVRINHDLGDAAKIGGCPIAPPCSRVRPTSMRTSGGRQPGATSGRAARAACRRCGRRLVRRQDMHDAARHAVTDGRHPGWCESVEIVLLDPAAGEVGLMRVSPGA